jgi:hypothetical protein
MATVNQIEQKILEMDGGAFQKLCDAYLSAIGYGHPNSLGSHSGTNKVRKGTPDTFFEAPGGKLIFAEYTTQKSGLVKKLDGDLSKCLDEKKTKVPVERIAKIVFCYTSQLEPGEALMLRTKAEHKGVELTFYGISVLSNDLLGHPRLLRHYLDLQIDTGQIIPLDEFPAVYGRSKFATTLETKFRFRKRELESVTSNLETVDLVVISGKAGVGKSRFALEACRLFCQSNPEFEKFAVVSHSQSLYDDLHEQFADPGYFLILVDDANRVADFSYFMYMLRNPKPNQKFKIIVTVRDYATEKIKNDIGKFHHESLLLDQLSDEQIVELAKDEFGIHNHLFLERITDLSKGNPRIAVMVSRIAIEKDNLQSISDVSALYDEYFSSITHDLNTLSNKETLKTAGIIAFLRAFDRTNEEMMSGIEKAFQIPTDRFWTCVYQLHELEMVDMYENEVVRISDQVLSTYLFYLAVFKEKVIDFSDILKNYFPRFRNKVADSLNPVLSAFDQNALYDFIRPKIQNLWGEAVTENNQEYLLSLAGFFWHLLPTETLIFIRKRLSNKEFLQADLAQLSQLDDNKLNNIELETEIEILGAFRYAGPDFQRTALEILLDCINIRPADILQILHVLVDDFGFNRFSHQTGVGVQSLVVDALWARTNTGENELFSQLFIRVAEQYLKTNFQTHEMRSEAKVTFYNFGLHDSDDVLQLRTRILKHLFELYYRNESRVINVLEKYIAGYHSDVPHRLLSNDAEQILEFISAHLDPEKITHNIFVKKYLDFLERYSVEYDKGQHQPFQNTIFEVYELISQNRFEHLSYKDAMVADDERFAVFFRDASVEKVDRFIEISVMIGTELNTGHDQYEVKSGFEKGLKTLSEIQFDMFEYALNRYLTGGDLLELNPHPMLHILFSQNNKEKIQGFLGSLNIRTKNKWLFAYLEVLPAEQIGPHDMELLFQLFRESDSSLLPIHLDFLINFLPFDNRIVPKIFRIILDKDAGRYAGWSLKLAMYSGSEINKRLAELFSSDLEILKKSYLAAKTWSDHADHDSETLCKIIDLDSEFITEYINWIYQSIEKGAHWRRSEQNYFALWGHPNYLNIFGRIIELISVREAGRYWSRHLENFFMADSHREIPAEIAQRQDEVLCNVIRLHHSDMDWMVPLFEVISSLPPERRVNLIGCFVKFNKSLSDFQKLQIEPGSMSWSGSAVPVYQDRIDNLTALYTVLTRTELLEHRLHIQQMITDLEKRMRLEKKRDFVGE